MRVVHVSAHYPPNFVSGGTLVPQRMARALRERGHEVSVYAGYLDEQRPELQTWTDHDETGLAVRWIVSTPWIGWGDRRNFDNPMVARDFAGHLREVRPDVVHFHSLQSLGAGLLPVAREAGARVVVTAHDFWWVCSRQFLVDTTERPCSPVVDCGQCGCQVDREFLVGRNRWLAQRLESADLVLAPSAPAARLLAANGVAPDRLVVDENGLPDDSVTAQGPDRSPGQAVRFLYAGGPNALKGWSVLLEATRRLQDLEGWVVHAYGVQGDESVRDAPSGVQAHQPYPPDALPEVLADADVLVLPSLARESHSILTREALLAGLPVVTSDAPGPTDVVTDGVNGLVVPAADTEALADALRSLVERPRLLEALRASTGPGCTPVRRFDDQVDGLERRYRELVEQPAAATRVNPVREVLFVCGITGAPLRYRAHLPAEGLRLAGVTAHVVHYRDPRARTLAGSVDAVVLYRVPATPQVLELAELVRSRREPVPLLFDVDDLIFDPEIGDQVHGLAALDDQQRALWWQGVRRYRTTMEQADGFVASTDVLAEHARSTVGMPAWRFANGAGGVLARASDAAAGRPRRPGPVRLGYFSGTSTHDHDWAFVEPAVLAVMNRHPDVELWLGGLIRPTSLLDAVADRVHRLPMVDWRQLPELLRDVDVNLAPLAPGSTFNESKSAIKWLEAALVETVTVASPTQPFREVVRHGRNGFLATTRHQWEAHLERLVSDPGLRRRAGQRARQDVLLELSPHLQGRRYLTILQEARRQVAADGHREPSPAWVPELVDEPWTPVPLEPYDPDPADERQPPVVVSRLGAQARRAAGVYRDRGAVGFAQGAARAGRRAVRRRLGA